MIKKYFCSVHVILVTLAALVIFIMIFSGCYYNQASEEYITIGAILPLTGEYSDDGIRAFNGLHLAKSEINENGGISGKKLDIIILDDKGEEDNMPALYHELKSKGAGHIIIRANMTQTLVHAAEIDGIRIISPDESMLLFDASDPAAGNFVKNYLDIFAQIPDAVSFAAYECAKILAEEIKTGNGKTGGGVSG